MSDIIKSITKINQSFNGKEMITAISFNLGGWQTQAIKNNIQNCHGHVRLQINPLHFGDYEDIFKRKIYQESHFKYDIDAMNDPIMKILTRFESRLNNIQSIHDREIVEIKNEISGIKNEIVGIRNEIKIEIATIRFMLYLNFFFTFLIVLFMYKHF